MAASIHRVRRLRAVPATLPLRPAGQGTSGLVGKIYVDDPVGEPVAISSVVSSHPAVRCKVSPEKQLRHLIEVSCDPQAKDLPKTCTLRIVVREPVPEEATVQVVLPSPSASALQP